MPKRPKFRIVDNNGNFYRKTEPIPKTYNHINIPPIPKHLEKHFISPQVLCRKYHEFVRTIEDLRPKWESVCLKDTDQQFQFLEAINCLVICARTSGAVAYKSMDTLIKELLLLPINKTTQKFLSLKLRKIDEAQKEKWEGIAIDIVMSFIRGDRFDNIWGFFSGGAASDFEQRHRHVVNKDFPHFFNVLLDTIKVNEWLDERSDLDKEGEVSDPTMRRVLESLACRKGDDIFECFSDKFRKDHKLIGGGGYDPYYLRPEDMRTLRYFQDIKFWYESFNEGELDIFRSKLELDDFIEKYEIDGLRIEDVFRDFQAIPPRTPNLFDYLFKTDTDTKTRLFWRLERLHEILKMREIRIEDAPLVYEKYADGIRDHENTFLKYQQNEDLKERLNKNNQEEVLRQHQIKDACTAIEELLTPNQKKIWDLMIMKDGVQTKVAKELKFSPAYISKEWKKIKDTIKENPTIRELIKDLF